MSQGSWDPRDADEDRPWFPYKPDPDDDSVWSVGRLGWGGGIVDFIKTEAGERQVYASRAEAQPLADLLNEENASS